MICIDDHCSACKHIRDNIDGWKMACDAFPDGIPNEILLMKKEEWTKMRECNNGIGYEKDKPWGGG